MLVVKSCVHQVVLMYSRTSYRDTPHGTSSRTQPTEQLPASAAPTSSRRPLCFTDHACEERSSSVSVGVHPKPNATPAPATRSPPGPRGDDRALPTRGHARTALLPCAPHISPACSRHKTPARRPPHRLNTAHVALSLSVPLVHHQRTVIAARWAQQPQAARHSSTVLLASRLVLARAWSA